jgi:hypothetical protein
MRLDGLVRVAREKRPLLLPLVIALIINAAVAGLLVFPMSRRVADTASEQTAAAAALRAAEQECASVTAAVKQQQAADASLARFYTEVLPADMSSARRQTYLKLAQLADSAGLRIQRRVESVQEPKALVMGPNEVLTRFETAMVLRGDYDGVRQFINEIETGDEFMAIDTISLSEGIDPGSPLVLSMVMSTYYRTEGHGR